MLIGKSSSWRCLVFLWFLSYWNNFMYLKNNRIKPIRLEKPYRLNLHFKGLWLPAGDRGRRRSPWKIIPGSSFTKRRLYVYLYGQWDHGRFEHFLRRYHLLSADRPSPRPTHKSWQSMTTTLSVWHGTTPWINWMCRWISSCIMGKNSRMNWVLIGTIMVLGCICQIWEELFK